MTKKRNVEDLTIGSKIYVVHKDYSKNENLEEQYLLLESLDLKM